MRMRNKITDKYGTERGCSKSTHNERRTTAERRRVAPRSDGGRLSESNRLSKPSHADLHEFRIQVIEQRTRPGRVFPDPFGGFRLNAKAISLP